MSVNTANYTFKTQRVHEIPYWSTTQPSLLLV